jgi:RNA polymerase sigma-70 factor, ECF subfamily
MGMEQVAELVVRAQQGDSAAISDLYERYSPVVYRFLRRRIDGSDQVVEDLTADVFVKVFQKLDRYVERGLPFTAWLYRIAHNCLVDYLRTLPRQSATSLDAVAEMPESQAGREFGRVLDRAMLEPALAKLTDEQREAIELRFFEGLPVADAAARMGRSEEAVKKLQARGGRGGHRRGEVAAQVGQRARRVTVAA